MTISVDRPPELWESAGTERENIMRHNELEDLAKAEVGLADSRYVFINVNGSIVSAHLMPTDTVIEIAETLDQNDCIIVEDRTGIAWENDASEREQARLHALEGE